MPNSLLSWRHSLESLPPDKEAVLWGSGVPRRQSGRLSPSGGSRHLVWGGPRGAEGTEVEHRRREDQCAEGAELGRVRRVGVPSSLGVESGEALPPNVLNLLC